MWRFWSRYGSKLGCGDEAVAAGGYRLDELSPECDALAAAVARVHALVGNAIVGGGDDDGGDPVYIVFGIGSTELISASMWALADGGGDGADDDPADGGSDDGDASAPALVWSDVPYYSGYRGPAGYFNSSSPRFRWLDPTQPDTRARAERAAAAGRRVVELVTSPNNPDGAMRSAVLSGPGARAVRPSECASGEQAASERGAASESGELLQSKPSGGGSARALWDIHRQQRRCRAPTLLAFVLGAQVYDSAYYWPHFTPIDGSVVLL